jgi:hypothetical protein
MNSHQRGDIINDLLGRRANSLHGTRSKGDGEITDEVYTYDRLIKINTPMADVEKTLAGMSRGVSEGVPCGGSDASRDGYNINAI